MAMSTLSARLYFSLPFELAEEYFNEGLARLSDSGLHELQLNARIPLTTIDVAKNVVAECFPDPETRDAWEIRWVPEPGGMYPAFQGKLLARKNAKDNSTILELSGNYDPPLGTAGVAFDHVVGKKIAGDTAHTLLLNIASEMRVRYAIEEARHVFQFD